MMADRMPGFSQAVAEYAGASGEALYDMLNNGEITLDDIMREGAKLGQYPQAGADIEAFVLESKAFHLGDQPSTDAVQTLPRSRSASSCVEKRSSRIASRAAHFTLDEPFSFNSPTPARRRKTVPTLAW